VRFGPKADTWQLRPYCEKLGPCFKGREGKMGFIRRLIIATAEWTSILSIFVFTYAGGVYGQFLFHVGDSVYKTALCIRGAGIALRGGVEFALIAGTTATAAFFC